MSLFWKTQSLLFQKRLLFFKPFLPLLLLYDHFFKKFEYLNKFEYLKYSKFMYSSRQIHWYPYYYYLFFKKFEYSNKFEYSKFMYSSRQTIDTPITALWPFFQKIWIFEYSKFMYSSRQIHWYSYYYPMTIFSRKNLIFE